MRFNPLPTKRLLVRRLRPTDAETLSEYRSLPEISKFQSSYSLERARSLVQEMSQSDPAEKGKWCQFAIELTSEQKLIGDIGFLNTDEHGKSWIGFTLHPRYWHQGYAAEAVRAVLAYYRDLGFTTFWASTDPGNAASMKLLRKLGFELAEAKSEDMIFVLR